MDEHYVWLKGFRSNPSKEYVYKYDAECVTLGAGDQVVVESPYDGDKLLTVVKIRPPEWLAVAPTQWVKAKVVPCPVPMDAKAARKEKLANLLSELGKLLEDV